jgi:DNA invertase Pin-like site-specific DNA recombinase
MAVVGYARTSTEEQEAGFEAQLERLKDCERVYKEKVSSIARREQLDLMLDWVRDGDTVVVTSLSRLGGRCSTSVIYFERFRRSRSRCAYWTWAQTQPHRPAN